MANTKCIVYILLLLVGSSLILLKFLSNEGHWVEDKSWFYSNPLDGCHHVYLDMGTNVGNQIRKIFEPNKFPGSPVFPIFNQYFGSPENRNLNEICVVGFEPNPLHTPEIEKLERAYKKCGWKVLIHKETGVSTKESVAHFSKIKDVPFQMAGRLLEANETKEDEIEVKTIWLANFINKVVATRRIPNGSRGNVVMKLDVEGMEMELVPDLVMSGALSHIDYIYIEWHAKASNKVGPLAESMKLLVKLAEEKKLHHVTKIVQLDDEKYYTYTGNLPVC